MLSKKNIAIIILILLVGAVYLPSLFNGFVNWDDDVHLLENIYIQPLNLHTLQAIFTTTVNKIYIPLTSLTFAIEQHFFGPDPFIYHLNNLLLHLFVTVAVMIFAQQCGLTVRAAFMAALLFGIHPMHVESVAWVTERKDVLYAAFYMAALMVYCKHLKDIASDDCSRHKRFKFIWVVVLGVLSALAKPMALSLPLILFLCDWYFKRPFGKRMILEKIYLGIFMAPIIWMTYILQARAIGMQPAKSVALWIWCFIFYLKKFFAPDHFANMYTYPRPIDFANAGYLISLIIFVILAGAILFYRKHRLFIFAMLFYVFSIFFLLRMDIGADTHLVGDRFMYLPSIGWCMLLGYGIEKLFHNIHQPGQRVMLGALIASAFLWILFLTVNQIGIWKNSVTFWTHQLEVEARAYPSLTYGKLAWAHMEDERFNPNNEKDVARIVELFNMALFVKRDDYNVYWGLGELHKSMKDKEGARYFLEKTIAIKPDHFEAELSLVELKYNERTKQESALNFCRIVESNPNNPKIIGRIRNYYFNQAKDVAGWNKFEPLCRESMERYKPRQ